MNLGKLIGLRLAASGAMAGVVRLEDLAAWQLANELRGVALRVAGHPSVAADARYRAQLTDAASSAARNIAEGFARFKHKEFAQFLRVARGSESEVLDLLHEAHQRGLLSAEELAGHQRLARKAMSAAAGLIRYLERTPDRR
jgi:four helix bundle protein